MSNEVGDNGEIECLACNSWFIPNKPGQVYCSELNDYYGEVEYRASDDQGNEVVVVLSNTSPGPKITINGQTAEWCEPKLKLDKQEQG